MNAATCPPPAHRVPARHYVCRAGELPPGERKIIQVGNKGIGVFNLAGHYYALLNVCPHQFAPLCLGEITGYCAPSKVGEYRWERVGEIIRCPWHSWEFDIKTGRSVFNPNRVKTRSYEVQVETAPEEKAENVETFGVSVEEGSVYVLV